MVATVVGVLQLVVRLQQLVLQDLRLGSMDFALIHIVMLSAAEQVVCEIREKWILQSIYIATFNNMTLAYSL